MILHIAKTSEYRKKDMSSFSVKAEKLTPEIIRIGQVIHDSHEILTELPFRIWIQKYNLEEANEPGLTLEYSKDKIGESSPSESIHIENIFSVSIDRVNPMFSMNDNLGIQQSDIEELKNWIKDNYKPLIKLRDKGTVLIRHYPVRIEWFYD